MPDNETSAAILTRKAIAGEVRAELARQSKNHRDLGVILGLPQSSVSLRLSGERPFRAEELVLVAQGLGVPVEHLLRIPALAAVETTASAA